MRPVISKAPPFGQKSKDGRDLLACCVKTCTPWRSTQQPSPPLADHSSSWDCQVRQSTLHPPEQRRESPGSRVRRYCRHMILDPNSRMVAMLLAWRAHRAFPDPPRTECRISMRAEQPCTQLRPLTNEGRGYRAWGRAGAGRRWHFSKTQSWVGS